MAEAYIAAAARPAGSREEGRLVGVAASVLDSLVQRSDVDPAAVMANVTIVQRL
jgi:hypothetical protein